MTDRKRTILDWIRKLDPIHRKKVLELNSLKNMDDNLLIERIRHMGHHVDLITKYSWRENKGKEIVERLNKALAEYESRGLNENHTIKWVNERLKNYEIWYEKKQPLVDKTAFKQESELLKVMIERRSIRKWTEQPVPEEVIQKVISAAIEAPSSCNRQAWKFTIVNKENRKLLEHRTLEEAPVVILVSIDERPYFFHEKHAPALDTGFAAQNALLMAHSLGLGACPVYFAYPYIQKAKKELGIEKYRKVYLAIALGYPAENPEKPARPIVEDVMSQTL